MNKESLIEWSASGYTIVSISKLLLKDCALRAIPAWYGTLLSLAPKSNKVGI